MLFFAKQHLINIYYVQGRRHDFKSEGDKTWFTSEASEKKFSTPTFGKVGGTFFFHVGGKSKQITISSEYTEIFLSGCRINKYVIGLYYSTMNQWRREFHVSAVNNIYEDWNRTHGPFVARRAWIMMLCAMRTMPFWTSFISRNWCRNLFWEKKIVGRYLQEIF